MVNDIMKEVLVGNCIKVIPPAHKIKESMYLPAGRIPVIDQGSEFVGGYIDDEELAYNGPLPVIVFGDHTCTYKFVNFTFAIGGDGTQIIRPIEEFDIRYFYYCLRTLPLEQFGYQRHFKYLKNFKVIWLPISLQHKIAAILSAYDDLIENNTRRIQILEEMAQRIYQEWFVNFRFPGHEKVKFIESELGKIPEGWEVKSIMDKSYWDFISKNVSPYEGEKEYFATANIEGIEIIKEGVLVTYNKRPSRAQKQPVLFSVWFARMKDTYKVLGFTRVNEDEANKSILSSGFAGFKTNEFAFPYVFLTIKSEEFHKKKDQLCTGATQMSLTNEGLKKIKIIVPNKNILEDFSVLTLPLLDKIFSLQKINKLLRTTRDLLLPKLISGELDVSNLDITVKNGI